MMVLGAALNMVEVWMSPFLSRLSVSVKSALSLFHIRLKNRVSVSIYEPIMVPAGQY